MSLVRFLNILIMSYCNCPVHIMNPTRNFKLRDRVFMSVPCNHCSGCRRHARNSWFVRSYYQYLETTEIYKGHVFFFTLTYNEENIPIYNGYRVFSKTDIQKFLKRFRITLSRDAGRNVDVRYLITSEFGDKRHRPHYHGMLYINTPLSYFQKRHIEFLIYRCWSKGIVRGGKYGYEITSPQAIHYVCKYISKDIDFDWDLLPKRKKLVDKPVLKNIKIVDNYNDIDNFDLVADSLDHPVQVEDKQIPREYAPFHLQSQHFGEYMIKRLGLSKEFDNAFNYMVSGVFYLPGYDKPYAIPQYVQRKVLYDYIYKRNKDKSVDVQYILNKFGKDVRKEQEFLSIEHREQELKRVLRNAHSYFFNYFDERLKLLNARLGTDFQNPLSIDEWIDNQNINWSNLAVYSSAFMNRIYLPVSDYDVFSNDIDGESYTLHTARNYLDFLYSDYLDEVHEIYDNDFKMTIAGVTKHGLTLDLDSIPRTDKQKVYDYISTATFANTFPDIYSLYIELYNTLEFFAGLDADRKEFEKERLYRDAKLLSKEVI